MKFNVLLILTLFLTSCGMFGSKKDINDDRSEVDKLITKKKSKSLNVNTKDRALSDENSGIVLGKGNVDPLGRQNVMWRATMKALDFIPINTADYSGGLIVTDWYSPDISNESVKINVSFNSNEVKVSSISVKSFKKNCDKNQACKISPMTKDFNNKIKNQILAEVKNINIEKAQ